MNTPFYVSPVFVNRLKSIRRLELTANTIRSTFITDQSEFIENSQNGKQLGKLLDMPKRPQAP